MLSEVTSANPDVDPETAGRWINNYYRKVIDMRNWYGLKLRGQVTVPNLYQQGQVSCTQANPIVTGINTNWSTAPAGQPNSLIGLQFRTSFNLAYSTITNVIDPTHLQLDIPFTGTTGVTGYQIAACYINFGANIKRLLWAVNQQQGWPMKVNVPVEVVNKRDTWRTYIGWSTCFATRSPAPDGSFIAECWPTPFQFQVFPFEAYQQPPNLVLDSDVPVAWIASDLLVTRAISDALVFRGPKMNKYYDATTSTAKRMEFNERVESMAGADDNMDVQDVTWDYSAGDDDAVLSDGMGLGATWSQNHA